jgi:DNA-directed RNA polymerase specialized sigma24 family protein
VAALPGDDLRDLIRQVCQEDRAAWTTFIERFAPLLLQCAHVVERDRDAAADAFVFICERLRERRAARLATFDFGRTGSFETWLRAVALNLARDARRRRVGRFRPFALVDRLPPLEQRVFRLRYEVGLTFDQILQSLRLEFPGLTEARLAEADAQVAKRVSAQQRWTLLTRRPQLESMSDADAETGTLAEPVSEQPGPEWLALSRESHQRLADAMGRLSVEDRVLLRLHIERGVTLAALASMFGLTNAQAVHRRVRDLLAQLRQMLDARGAEL